MRTFCIAQGTIVHIITSRAKESEKDIDIDIDIYTYITLLHT